MKPKRFSVLLINLDPTIGSEIKKTRPCLCISPDEMNYSNLDTVIVAPMTTTLRDYPTRVDVKFKGKKGQIALDQLRAIDRKRIIKNMGRIDSLVQSVVMTTLGKLFCW